MEVELPPRRRLDKLNRSGYVGVSYNASKKKFVAGTKIKGRKIHIGTFVTAELAYAAYLECLKKHGVIK